jgi:hypothetical protein
MSPDRASARLFAGNVVEAVGQILMMITRG